MLEVGNGRFLAPSNTPNRTYVHVARNMNKMNLQSSKCRVIHVAAQPAGLDGEWMVE